MVSLARTAFRSRIESALAGPPVVTPGGRVLLDAIDVRFGHPLGNFESVECWRYLHNDSGLEMLFGFYGNFTPDDFIVKIHVQNDEVPAGAGASVQFNGDRCMFDDGLEASRLEHEGLVTLKHRLSRADLLATIDRVAPEVSNLLGGLHFDGGSFELGSTRDLGRLLDRLFVYCFGVEQAKRALRGDSPLRSLSAEAKHASSV